MRIYAVHQTSDCMDYNEHFYFTDYDKAIAKFNWLVDLVKQLEPVEIYSDEDGNFYCQHKDGADRIYIENIGDTDRTCEETGEIIDRGWHWEYDDTYTSTEDITLKRLRDICKDEIAHLVDSEALKYGYKEEFFYWTDWSCEQ